MIYVYIKNIRYISLSTSQNTLALLISQISYLTSHTHNLTISYSHTLDLILVAGGGEFGGELLFRIKSQPHNPSISQSQTYKHNNIYK